MVKYLNKSILEYMSSELHVMVDRTIQYFNSVHKVFKSDERHKICAEASCIHNHYLSWTKLSNNYQLTLLFNMIRLYLPNSHVYVPLTKPGTFINRCSDFTYRAHMTICTTCKPRHSHQYVIIITAG